MSYIRSFTAIDLPPDLKEQVGVFQEKLKNVSELVRWEHPENFHLNLLFLGSVKEDNLKALSSVFTKRFSFSTFELRPKSFDYLYKKHEDSILYLSVDGDLGPLRSLQGEVLEICERALNLTFSRRFLPHITLGRLKSFINPPEKKKILADLIDIQPSSFRAFDVSGFKIMKRIFSKDGDHQYRIFFESKFKSLEEP